LQGKYKTDVEALQGDVQALDEQNSQLRSKYTTDVSALQGDIQGLIQELDAANAHNVSLHSQHCIEVAGLQSELLALDHKAQASEATAAELQAKYASDVEALQEQLEAHSATLSQLRVKYSIDVEALQLQVSSTTQASADLQSRCTGEIRALQDRLVAAQAMEDALRSKSAEDVQTLQLQADALREEVSRLDAQRQELEQRLATSEAAWRQDVDEIQKRCDKDVLGLLRELASAREDCISSAATVVDLQKVVDLAFEERRCLAGETERWKRAHESSEQEVQTLRSSMSALQQEMEGLRGVVDRETKAASAKVAGLQAELGAAQAASRSQDTRCSELQLRNRELCVQLMEVQEQVTQERLRASELEVCVWGAWRDSVFVCVCGACVGGVCVDGAA
jgi:chromosome segregation ATPase